MIILDFIKTKETINGKLFTRKYIVRKIKENTTWERTCLEHSNMSEIQKLYNLEGEDQAIYENTIGCNYWHNGINCLLDPLCGKKKLCTNKQEINVLFHTENNRAAKVAILITIPTQIIQQDYAHKYAKHLEISKLLIRMIPQEVRDIYEEYLRKENAK